MHEVYAGLAAAYVDYLLILFGFVLERFSPIRNVVEKVFYSDYGALDACTGLGLRAFPVLGRNQLGITVMSLVTVWSV